MAFFLSENGGVWHHFRVPNFQTKPLNPHIISIWFHLLAWAIGSSAKGILLVAVFCSL